MERLKEVLAFANNKGGVAKTTTVQNVAAGMLRRDPSLRILCIDLDPQGNLSSLLGWREKMKQYHEQKHSTLTVADALRDGDSNHLPVYQSREGLFYVPASPMLAEIDPDLHRQMQPKLVLASLFGNDIHYMDNLYMEAERLDGDYIEDCFDYVLIDCAPLGAAIDAAVIAKECDGAVIVISQGEVSSRAVVSVKRQLEASGVRILGAVLNKVDKKKTGYYGKYYGNYYGNYYGRQGKVMQKRSVPQKASMKQNLEDIKRASMAIEKDNQEDEEGQQNEKQHSKEAAKEED